MKKSKRKVRGLALQEVGLLLHKCPQCGAEQGAPCRYPSGRKAKQMHDLRPFSIVRKENKQ